MLSAIPNALLCMIVNWSEGKQGSGPEGTNARTDEQKSPCVLQDFIPFGATALLPLTPIHNCAKQGNGYR